MESQISTITFMGQTGAGKTSLINSLFNLNWFVDEAISSTKELHIHIGKLSKKYKNDMIWKVIDTPGIGESESANEIYRKLLLDAFSQSDYLIWVVQSNTRSYAEDQYYIFNEIGKNNKKPHNIIIINQIDKIHPEDWDKDLNTPSILQKININEKKDLIYNRFKNYLNINKESIFPASTKFEYGLDDFLNYITTLRI